MARPGITYIDVSKAAQIIKNQGSNPTVDRVLASLGTGSKSTIAPFLKQWKGENGQGPANVEGLPDELVNGLKGLYEQVTNQANESIKLEKEKSQKTIDQHQQNLTIAEDTATTLLKANTVLKKQLEETGNLNASLIQQLDKTTLKLEKKEIELSNTKQQLINLKETIDGQKAEICRIRDHLEHYQTEIIEERHRERQQLQAQIIHLETNLSQTYREKENVLNKVDLLEKLLNQSQKQLHAYEVQNKEVTATLKILNKDKQLLENDVTEGSEKIKLIKQQLIDANNLLQNIEKENAVFCIEQNILKTEQEKLEEKHTHLTNQYQILQQKKSILEGQFKQLVSTL